MYNHLLYLAYWAVNATVLFVLGLIYPDTVSLGVNKFVPLEAAVYGGFWLTFFIWCMWDLVLMRGVKLEPSAVAWTYFLLVNALGVFVISYAAKFTGIEVSGTWIWLVAVFTNGLQRVLWSVVVGQRS